LRVTLKWLEKYVEIEESAQEIADMLTLQGLEVSECIPVRPRLEGVITSRIVSLEPHPSSQGLWVCRMETGEQNCTVLCGAQNVAVGDCVPLAVPGTSMPDGKVIEAATLHGIVSEGMLCSELELKLSEDNSGIMKLPADTSPGLEIGRALALEDDVLDVEVTPNRPDCTSVIGIAREVAGFTGQKMDLPVKNDLPLLTGEGVPFSVEILDPEDCPRYTARLLENVERTPGRDLSG